MESGTSGGTVYQQPPQSHNYNVLHFFPENESLELMNFGDFFNKRKELLKEKLMTILNVQKMSASLGFPPPMKVSFGQIS